MKRFAIALSVLAIAALAVPAAGQTYYYDYNPVDRPYDPTWPADGDEWHQLYPNYCIYDEQTGHEDANEDGYIDACEHIWINGERHHVEWVGPTFHLREIMPPGEERQRREIYMEQVVLQGDRPHVYHEVYPVFCTEVGTTEPIEFECQEVFVEFPPEYAGWWHVEEITTNIHTVPQSPVEGSTWSTIKDWFRDLF
ncbi:MAG: hypothetical protein GF400_00370 [Candidatus Eisenbacteria bacterium]|nr:hypothetical protein [Candidatus Eisenbacteria bacterium]